MNIITDEELGYLKVPERTRRQFHSLMDYLRAQDHALQSVCSLYGLRRTGKTTLILQVVRELIGQGADPETIGYFTGQKGDTFDDLTIELEARKKLKYIFICHTSAFTNTAPLCWVPNSRQKKISRGTCKTAAFSSRPITSTILHHISCYMW